MLRVKTKRLSDNKITHSTELETQEEVDAYILKVEGKRLSNGASPFGWKERTIPSSEATPEEIASALEVIPAVLDGEEVVSPEMVRLPKTYEIIIEDISAQLSQEATNAAARKFLAESDWKTLRHKDELELGIPTSMSEQEFQALLQARQAARENIV